MANSTTVIEEYDNASKIWTTIFGVMLMLLIQWPTLLAHRLDSPPSDGSMGWNLIAVFFGLVAPISWIIGDLRRYRMALPWVITTAAILVWVVISFLLVHR